MYWQKVTSTCLDYLELNHLNANNGRGTVKMAKEQCFSSEKEEHHFDTDRRSQIPDDKSVECDGLGVPDKRNIGEESVAEHLNRAGETDENFVKQYGHTDKNASNGKKLSGLVTSYLTHFGKWCEAVHSLEAWCRIISRK